MSKQGLKLGAFVKYYLVSLASLSFLCLILYGLYSLNGLIPFSLDRASGLEVKHYSGQTTSSVKKDGDYNVDLKVTNDGGKVIQTYVFEYKK